MREGRSKEFLDGTRRHGKYKVPLDRFLRSKVGQHWDKVYSEICKEFQKDTREWNHLKSWLKWKVETKTWKGAESGKIYNAEGIEVFGFYVHPISGCLQYVKEPSRNDWKKRDLRPLTEIPIDASSCYKRIDGIWYWISIRKNPDYNRYSPWSSPYDILNKRQLNSKELKTLELANGTPEEQEEERKERIDKEKKWRDGLSIHP